MQHPPGDPVADDDDPSDLGSVLPVLFLESAWAAAVLDSTGRFLHVNDAFAAIVGASPGDLQDIDLIELLGHDPERRTGDLMADRAAGNDPDVFTWYRIGRDSIELPLRHCSGRLVWLRGRITIVGGDDGGRPGVIFLAAVDVTAQRAQEPTDSAAARLAFDTAADGILLVDGDGLIRSGNARIRDLFGYEPAELEGQPIEVLIPPRLRDVHQRYRNTFLADPHTRPMGRGLDLTARRKDGSEFPVEVSLGASRDDGETMVTCVITDISQRKVIEEQLAFQATHDPLTGLPNRSLFVDRLEAGLAFARRHDRAVAVLFLDLDHFKEVNDHLGHSAGDEVLTEVGRRLQAVIRAQDTAARFGGDEFAVLCTDIDDESDAVRVAERILASLADPILVEGREVVISPSIGIAVAPPDPGDAEALIRDADAAMYTAKRLGRGRYELFNEVVRARAQRRLDGEQELRAALSRGELRLVYQPVIALATMQVVGIEALLRWQRPNGVVASPAEFIPLAEETGLIRPIGDWVFGQACQDMARLRIAHPAVGELGVSVNLGPSQLRDADLLAAVRSSLDRYDLPPSALTVEVTELALGESLAAAGRQLEDLEALGVSLAVDDFGTGYSSLRRLRELSVDTIKIDGSFVADVGREGDSRGDDAIVAAVIDLAHALGATVVAEGVERAEQLEVLRRAGCDYAQGFHISRPVPAGQLPALLAGSP